MDCLVNQTEYNNRKFSRDSLTELFFIVNKFHQLRQTTRILQVVTPRTFFSLPGSLQNQSKLLILQQKNKALPKGDQRLNSNNGKDQDRVLIHSRVGYQIQ